MSTLAGSVVWAIVPFAAEPPFRIYAGSQAEPFEVDGLKELIAAARSGGEAELTFLVSGKARPVLVVSDKYDPRVRELLALRLLSLEKLTPGEQVEVRERRHPNLFHLRPEAFDLPAENAAMVASLVRVPVDAIDPAPAGTLDRNELRVVHQRIARRYGLDLHLLVLEQIQALAAEQGRR